MKTSLVMLVVVAAILAGLLNLFSKGLLLDGLSPLQICAYREGITAVVFGVYLVLRDRSAFRIKPRDILIFVLFGLFNVISNISVFTAQETIPLELAAVLEMTSPYFILIFGVFLFGTKITRRKVLAAFIAFLGCILIIGLLRGTGDIKAIGILFGLLSGITLAAFTIGSKYVEKRGYSENTAMFYFFFFSTLLSIPFADLGETVNTVWGNWAHIIRVLIMGIACTLLPNFIVVYTTRRIDPAIVGIIITSSLIVSAICGVMAYGDPFDMEDVLGIVLILVAIVMLEPPAALREWYKRKRGVDLEVEER